MLNRVLFKQSRFLMNSRKLTSMCQQQLGKQQFKILQFNARHFSTDKKQPKEDTKTKEGEQFEERFEHEDQHEFKHDETMDEDVKHNNFFRKYRIWSIVRGI